MKIKTLFSESFTSCRAVNATRPDTLYYVNQGRKDGRTEGRQADKQKD